MARQGNPGAFDDLWQAHAKRILRTTYRITRNREDAEDALQDSFLRAFVHIREFDGRSSFSTWLTRIAINSSLMILRKRGTAVELSIDNPGDRGGVRKRSTCRTGPRLPKPDARKSSETKFSGPPSVNCGRRSVRRSNFRSCKSTRSRKPQGSWAFPCLRPNRDFITRKRSFATL